MRIEYHALTSSRVKLLNSQFQLTKKTIKRRTPLPQPTPLTFSLFTHMSSFSYLEGASANIPDASQYRFGIVVTEWNNHITDTLLEGAVQTLKQYGVAESSITIERVPGSFELIYASSQLAKRGYLDAVIAIGCVIKGDTPHFDYICQGTTQGIAHINATADTPIIYGVLTVNNEEQALERTTGKIGNKGKEFALSAIKMADFSWQLQN